MGFITNYPKQIIPVLLMIMKKIFPYLIFTEKAGVCQIWNLTKENLEFIQYLFVIIRNIQNSEFNFYSWVKSDVSCRDGNKFSQLTRKK